MGIREIVPGFLDFDPELGSDDAASLERLDFLIKLSRIPPMSRFTKRFHNFERVPGREAAHEAVKAFLHWEINPPLLLLYGEPGRSKTHLALAIAWNFLLSLKTVAYYHVGDLLDELRDSYRKKDDFATLELKFLKNCALVVLDDLGAHKSTEWAAEKLDTLVDHRYTNAKPLVITANTLELPDRIYDRCLQGKVVRLEGESYRALLRKGKEAADG